MNRNKKNKKKKIILINNTTKIMAHIYAASMTCGQTRGKRTEAPYGLMLWDDPK